jgi:hypothetical protein
VITPFEMEIFKYLNDMTNEAKAEYLKGGESSLDGFADYIKATLHKKFPRMLNIPKPVKKEVPTYSELMMNNR